MIRAENSCFELLVQGAEPLGSERKNKKGNKKHERNESETDIFGGDFRDFSI